MEVGVRRVDELDGIIGAAIVDERGEPGAHEIYPCRAYDNRRGVDIVVLRGLREVHEAPACRARGIDSSLNRRRIIRYPVALRAEESNVVWVAVEPRE